MVVEHKAPGLDVERLHEDDDEIRIPAVVCLGHQGASGTGSNFGNTCAGGSVRAQDSEFIKKGFNFRDHLGCEPYWGTLNCYIGTRTDIDPLSYHQQVNAQLEKFSVDQQFDPSQVLWSVQLSAIKWHGHFPAENFFLLKGHIQTSNEKKYPCYVYYPDPSTKPNNFFPKTILEIVAPPIEFPGDIAYGQKVILIFPRGDIALVSR